MATHMKVERPEVSGLATQSSPLEPMQVLHLQSDQWHSIWRPGELPELPQYTSVSDFAGRREVYQGRHSVVWSCRCKASLCHLVLKAYDKKKMNARHRQNAAREITILEGLHRSDPDRFPGVVEFLGTFEDRQYVYIVQDRCSQGDLFQQLLKRGGTMEESRVCTDVVVPLLLTLRHLHKRKIVHRDIKPENIFFTANNELKLGDFGLAIDAGKDKPLSRVGTLDYMAPEVLKMPTPEQIARQGLDVSTIKGYDQKIDIWALGVLIYELLAGRPPFEVEDPDQTALLIMHARLEIFPSHIGQQCVSFIQQALVKDPAARASADDLLRHPWVRQHFQIDPEPETRPPGTSMSGVCGAGLHTVPVMAWPHSVLTKGTGSITNNARVRESFAKGLASIVHIAAEGPSPMPSPVVIDKHTVHRRLAASTSQSAAKVCKPTSASTLSLHGRPTSGAPLDATEMTARTSADTRWHSCPGGCIVCGSVPSSSDRGASDDTRVLSSADSADESPGVLSTSRSLSAMQASGVSKAGEAVSNRAVEEVSAKEPCPIDAAVLEAWRARCQLTTAPRAPTSPNAVPPQRQHQQSQFAPPRNNGPASYSSPQSTTTLSSSSRFGPSRHSSSPTSSASPSRFSGAGTASPSRFAS